MFKGIASISTESTNTSPEYTILILLQERLSRLLECKVSMLKLTVSVRRTLGEMGSDDNGLTEDLANLLAAWDDAHQR